MAYKAAPWLLSAACLPKLVSLKQWSSPKITVAQSTMPDDRIKIANHALYRAKPSGRNNVVCRDSYVERPI
jgi:hypothetical protein